uniref:GPI mannosyltransferase 1 n=1 Tax=Candidozyma auris TaxID=498019 RepID=A0A0L0NSJ6_CANAR
MVALSTNKVIALGLLLRIGFFLFGIVQDKLLPVKYTDIDYLVFSDAAQYVALDKSPYMRETYRYTPLLAWILLPGTLGGLWEHYGKAVFILCDMLTGILIIKSLQREVIPDTRPSATFFQRNKLPILSAIWILNPMVITISTRGSSESVLSCLIMLAIENLMQGQLFMSAVWLGLSIHFKIYPVIFLPAIMLHLVAKRPSLIRGLLNVPVIGWINSANMLYFVVTLVALALTNFTMYHFYGYEFLYHSYIYHLTRLDHRHNFSLYNTALQAKAAKDYLINKPEGIDVISLVFGNIEKIAFVPQLLLSGIIIPVALARQNLMGCLFIQTLTFVTFNKVITSQYFIWYLIFLPGYLAKSKIIRTEYRLKGFIMIASWVLGQGLWLFYAYRLEFIGENTFNELLIASVIFFITNCWLIGEFISLA